MADSAAIAGYADALKGYASAVASERVNRDAAFILHKERIAKFDVWPMNLRHYIALRSVENPILFGAQPCIEHLAQFIWTVSVEYRPSRAAQVEWFKRSGLIEPRPPRIAISPTMARWALALDRCGKLHTECVADARRYVTETLADRPQARHGGTPSKSYYSDACFWCAMMGREYGTSIDYVMEMPLKQLFQFLNEIKDFNGKQGSLSNPSDTVIARWQTEQQQRIGNQ